MKRSFYAPTLTLIGTIIGAGIFALPQAFADVGIWPASAVFWFIALVMTATHLMMVDIELSVHKRMRLVGAVKRWLGPHVFAFASVSYPCQLIGASVAYLVLGGAFLHTLIKPLAGGSIPLFVMQTLFWIGGVLTIVGGLTLLAKVESWATWFLLGALVCSSVWVWQQGEFVTIMNSWSGSLTLFGVSLFSLGGIPGMGEVVELADRDRRRAQQATIIGTLVAAAVSWGFAISFSSYQSVGQTNALNLLLAGAGFLAVATSYIVTAQDLRATFRLDLGLHARAALVCAVGIPLALTYMMNPSSFGVVSTVGTIFGSVNGVLVALTAAHLYAERKRKERAPLEILCVVIGLVYLLGMAHWIWERVIY